MGKKKRQNKGWIDFNSWKNANLPKGEKNPGKKTKKYKNTQDGEFINPYNFVRLPSDTGTDDRSAPFQLHHKYQDNCYTGRLVCSLKVITPLFIPDPGTRELIDGGKKGERLYFNRNSNGNPSIPATSIKGMIRNIYETITSSCFSQLNTERLDFRNVKISQSLTLRPAIVTALDRKRKLVEIAILDGMAWLPAYPGKRDLRNKLHKNGHPPRAYASIKQKLYIVKAKISEELSEAELDSLRKDFKATVSEKNEFRAAQLIETEKNDLIKRIKPYLDGKVRIIEYDLVTEKLQDVPGKLSSTRTGLIQHEVLVKNTGKTIYNKHDERVFYSNKFSNNLIQNLRQLDRKEIPFECVRDLDYILSEQFQRFKKQYGEAAAKEEMEMRLNRRGFIEINEGDLVYYFERTGKQYLAIVLVPRLRYTRSPGDLLPQHLRPCRSYDRLCPACRLFGFTPDNKGTTSTKSLRGRLCVSSAIPVNSSEISFKKNILLKILGSPHPTSTNFYLINQKEKNRKPVTVENGGYDAKNVELRGRKFYWLKGDETHSLQKEAFSRPHDSNGTPFDRWVELLEPGATFTFHIDFENLSRDELSRLVWAIELEDGMYHRLGMGKPLGLGAVKITVDSEKSYVYTTEDIKNYYSDPDKKPDASGTASLLEDLKKDARSHISNLSFYRDLKAILSYNDKLAGLVKYPQKSRKVAGKIQYFGYAWFSSNKDQSLCTIEEITENNQTQIGWQGGTK